MRARLTLVAAVLTLLSAVACGTRDAQPRYVYYPLPDQAGGVVEELPGAVEGDALSAADDPAPVGYVDARPAADRVSRETPPPVPSIAGLPAGAVGKVEIPKVGMSQPMYEGVALSVLARGPGHWSGTAMPGDHGNAVVAGHRVTHTRPFFDLDQLAPGDQVIFTTAAGRFTYAVTKAFVVTPDATWIANQTPDATMTLFACHPKHQKSHRYVVIGQLVAAQRTAPPPPPPPPPAAHHSPPPPPPQHNSPPPAPAQSQPYPTPTTTPNDGRCRAMICLGGR